MKEKRIFIYKNYCEWMNFLYVYVIYLILLLCYTKARQYGFGLICESLSNPLVYFLWQKREDGLSKAQAKVNMKH